MEVIGIEISRCGEYFRKMCSLKYYEICMISMCSILKLHILLLNSVTHIKPFCSTNVSEFYWIYFPKTI